MMKYERSESKSWATAQKRVHNGFGFASLMAVLLLSSCSELFFEEEVHDPLSTQTVSEIQLESSFYLPPTFDFRLESLVNKDNLNAFVDLDSGQRTNSESADLYLMVSCGSDCFGSLLVINGAIAGKYGQSQPELSDCQNYGFPEDVLVPMAGEGYYSCFKTNEGRIFWVLVLEVGTAQDQGRAMLRYMLLSSD